MKKLTALICTAGMLCAIILSVQATWYPYGSIDELIHGNEYMPEKTILIVTGIATKQVETDIYMHPAGTILLPATITTIKVTEVLYGNVMSESIEVATIGNTLPTELGGPGMVPGTSGPSLEIGQEYLFFLFEPVWGRYLIGHPQRSYAIDSAGNIIGEDLLGVISVDNIKQFLTQVAASRSLTSFNNRPVFVNTPRIQNNFGDNRGRCVVYK